MPEQLTWEDIKREATSLEIWFGENTGVVWMEKYNSTCGWFQQSLAGRRRLGMASADKTGDREPRPAPQS